MEGLIHLHYRNTNLYDLPFQTMASKYPKMAVEEISKTHRLYCDWKPVQEKPVVTSTSSPVKKDHSFAQRSSMRPRYLGKMKSPTNLDFFKRYLKPYDAHGALKIYQEVDKLQNRPPSPPEDQHQQHCGPLLQMIRPW
eukprot:XP_014038924.1 PREDICTED: regulator of G-protein signaling protein-like [Salmo salar]